MAAAFSKYINIKEPTYYHPSVEDITALAFSNRTVGDPRLFLDVILWDGGRALQAKALVDSGATGDFLSREWFARNGVQLAVREMPLNFTAFEGSQGKGGTITHAWRGTMTLVSDDSIHLTYQISLNVTFLSGYNLILGIGWLRNQRGSLSWPGQNLLLEGDAGNMSQHQQE